MDNRIKRNFFSEFIFSFFAHYHFSLGRKLISNYNLNGWSSIIKDLVDLLSSRQSSCEWALSHIRFHSGLFRPRSKEFSILNSNRVRGSLWLIDQSQLTDSKNHLFHLKPNKQSTFLSPNICLFQTTKKI